MTSPTVSSGRIHTAAGQSFDISAAWDVHIHDSSSERVYLRLSDAHAEEDVAILYTTEIEPGMSFALTKELPDNLDYSGEWEPLIPGHLMFGASSECFNTCQFKITDVQGLMGILQALLKAAVASKVIPEAIIQRDAQGRIVAHFAGKTRSAMPRRTIETSGRGGGSRKSAAQSLQQLVANANAQKAASQTNGATPTTQPQQTPPQAPKPTPIAKPKGKRQPGSTSGTAKAAPAGPNGTKTAPAAPTAPGSNGPGGTASPFSGGKVRGGKFNGPLKKWF
jgi:hypothetical protein